MSEGPASEHLQRVASLARAVATHPVVVTIDGRSGSGKTTFAAALRVLLQDATVVHLDDIYPGWDGLAAAPALLAEQVLAPLRRGEPASLRRYDWERDEFSERVIVPDASFVLVEGAGASAAPARRYADVRVWLEAAEPVRKRRALQRDGDAYRPHWRRWADQETALFGCDHTRDHADVVVRTG